MSGDPKVERDLIASWRKSHGDRGAAELLAKRIGLPVDAGLEPSSVFRHARAIEAQKAAEAKGEKLGYREAVAVADADAT